MPTDHPPQGPDRVTLYVGKFGALGITTPSSPDEYEAAVEYVREDKAISRTFATSLAESNAGFRSLAVELAEALEKAEACLRGVQDGLRDAGIKPLTMPQAVIESARPLLSKAKEAGLLGTE